MFVSVKQACAKIGISRATLWRMIKDGRIPAPVRISPGRVAFRESDLATWAAALT